MKTIFNCILLIIYMNILSCSSAEQIEPETTNDIDTIQRDGLYLDLDTNYTCNS